MKVYPSVTKYMATKLVTFSPDTDIREAIDIMLKKKISGAPVLNKQGALIGMLSEVDCLNVLLHGPYDSSPEDKGLVRDFMTEQVRTISSERTILDAAYNFVHSGLKRLPVIENGKLVGQISRVDVLKAIQAMDPYIKHIPSSWKGRIPMLPKHKKTRHQENA